MTTINIVLSIIFLFLVPLLIGQWLCLAINKEDRITNYYVYGFVLFCAFIQLIGVPFVIFEKSFSLTKNCILIVSFLSIIVGIIARIIIKKTISFNKIKLVDVFVVLIVMVICFAFLYQVFTHQHIDEDDSRFVVSAVDMIETNSLYKINPATGFDIGLYHMVELNKDIVSPWAILLAFFSSVTGIKPVIMAHTVLPIALSILVMSVWWIFIDKLFSHNIMYQSMFTIIILLLAIYSDNNVVLAINQPLTKFILRIWQGKAVVASAGIPLMFVNMFDYYEKDDTSSLICILITNLGNCLMSANAIVIMPLIILSFGFVYMIIKKNIFIFLKLLPLIIPNLLYYILFTIV